jgi:hypothetical protein
MNVSTMPNASNPDQSSEIVGQDTQSSANALNTPFSESYLSQLVSDSAHSYVDLYFPDETIPDTNQVQSIGTHQSPFFPTSHFCGDMYMTVLVEAVDLPTTDRIVD